jgi:NMD protein affecting ribosome stability and mRNA decay
MPEPIRCPRCGDEDGPFDPDNDDLCEGCARPLPLTRPTP